MLPSWVGARAGECEYLAVASASPIGQRRDSDL
jgi:hypothetical protein